MTERIKRPVRITLLVWLVLIFTAWNGVRLATGLMWRDTLATYVAYPGPLYISLTGAIWTVAGLFWLWSFWRAAIWTRVVLIGAAGLYAAWFWVDRLLVQAQMRANWPFDLLITIILLAYIAFVVFDPYNENYFEKRGL